MADEAVAKQFDAVWGIAHPILDATIASLPAGAPTSTLQAWWAGANRTQGEVAKRLLAAALTFVQFLCLYYAYSWVLISVVLASLAPDEMAKGFKFIEGQVGIVTAKIPVDSRKSAMVVIPALLIALETLDLLGLGFVFGLVFWATRTLLAVRVAVTLAATNYDGGADGPPSPPSRPSAPNGGLAKEQ